MCAICTGCFCCNVYVVVLKITKKMCVVLFKIKIRTQVCMHVCRCVCVCVHTVLISWIFENLWFGDLRAV